MTENKPLLVKQLAGLVSDDAQAYRIAAREVGGIDRELSERLRVIAIACEEAGAYLARRREKAASVR